jgi:hypothetical protein
MVVFKPENGITGFLAPKLGFLLRWRKKYFTDRILSKFLPKMACFKKYADFGEPNIEY